MENEDSTLNTEKNERNFGFLTFIKFNQQLNYLFAPWPF